MSSVSCNHQEKERISIMLETILRKTKKISKLMIFPYKTKTMLFLQSFCFSVFRWLWSWPVWSIYDAVVSFLVLFNMLTCCCLLRKYFDLFNIVQLIMDLVFFFLLADVWYEFILATFLLICDFRFV